LRKVKLTRAAPLTSLSVFGAQKLNTNFIDSYFGALSCTILWYSLSCKIEQVQVSKSWKSKNFEDHPKNIFTNIDL